MIYSWPTLAFWAIWHSHHCNTNGVVFSYAPNDGSHLLDTTLYTHLVSNLLHLAFIRRDISYFVHILSQFVSSPMIVYYGHLFRGLCYFWETSSRCLFFSFDSFLWIHTYSDAIWTNDCVDRSSETGFCILIDLNILVSYFLLISIFDQYVFFDRGIEENA